MIVLVEGFAPDGIALARVLAGEGHAVRLAGRDRAPAAAVALGDEGVSVEAGVDLDAEPGPAEVAYLDVWTPEVAPRVRRLRASGARVTCLSELLLERTRAVSLGITGTAGKTTTAAFATQLLRAAGVEVAAGTRARAGNLWASEELIGRAADLEPPAVLALELTSSHLAFMRTSPDVAVVTSFWPDHLELHGSLAAYRAAKETIVRHQTSTGWIVVDADDPAVASFADLTPARRASFSLRAPVEQGASLRGDRVVARWNGTERELDATELPLAAAQRGSVVAAVTAALAAGAALAALPDRLSGLVLPAFRGQVVGRTASGVPIVDHGLAATPAKAAAALSEHADGSVVLVAGGETAPGGVRVHASPEERRLLERACDEAARAARAVFAFGPAGDELAELLGHRGAPVSTAASFEDAVRQAVHAARAGDEAVLLAPFYPVAQDDRERFGALARAAPGF